MGVTDIVGVTDMWRGVTRLVHIVRLDYICNLIRTKLGGVRGMVYRRICIADTDLSCNSLTSVLTLSISAEVKWA